MISINYNNCVNCLSCAKVCPLKAIDIKNGRAEFSRTDSCISCGHCVSVCPTESISADFYDSLPGKAASDLDLPSFNQVEDLILSRRSIRSYSNKEVKKEKIEMLLRMAAHAPTGSNSQNVKFIVTGPKGSAYLEQLAFKYFTAQPDNNIGEAMLKSDYRVLLGAPITIGLYSEKGSGIWNCAIAAQNLILAAHSLGLGTCCNGIFTGAYYKVEEIRKYFDLGEEEQMHMFVSMGYPNPAIRYRHTIERKKASVTWKE